MTRKISRALGIVVILINIAYFIPQTLTAHEYLFGEIFVPLLHFGSCIPHSRSFNVGHSKGETNFTPHYKFNWDRVDFILDGGSTSEDLSPFINT